MILKALSAAGLTWAQESGTEQLPIKAALSEIESSRKGAPLVRAASSKLACASSFAMFSTT
jgi:hypothetical protein